MASHRKLEPAAKSCAVNCHYDWLAAVFDSEKQWKEGDTAPGLSGSKLAEFLDVGAGNKGAAAPDQYGGAHVWIFVNLLNRIGNALRNSRTQGINWRVIDGDYSDIVVFSELDQFAHSDTASLAIIYANNGTDNINRPMGELSNI